MSLVLFFFFNDTATTEIYTLSLHDALPISHLSLTEIEQAITRVAGVRRVHDLHVWTLTSGREAMSAHVVVDDVRESERLLQALHAVLHARFGVDHTTIQLETAPPEVLKIKAPEGEGSELLRAVGRHGAEGV